MRKLTLLLFASARAFAGCQSDADVLASQFDQSCTWASDCVGVEELTARGGMCTFRCPHTAINVSAKAAFDAAKTNAAGRCTSVAMPDCVASGYVNCIAGTCGYSVESDAVGHDAPRVD